MIDFMKPNIANLMPVIIANSNNNKNQKSNKIKIIKNNNKYYNQK